MSGSSLQADTSHNAGSVSLARRGVAALSAPVRMLGFWMAVALPFLHVPLLLTGLDTTADTAAFFALLGINLVALVVGHSHQIE